MHPEGGCGLQRLGTYARVSPAGTRVARWWCPVARKSISLLPAFLAARLSGTLDEVEAVVSTVEQAGGVTAALERVHPAEAEGAIGLQCALRSMRRRVGAVHAALLEDPTSKDRRRFQHEQAGDLWMSDVATSRS